MASYWFLDKKVFDNGKRYLTMASGYTGPDRRKIMPEGRRSKDQTMTATIVDLGLIITIIFMVFWFFKIDSSVGSAITKQDKILNEIKKVNSDHTNCHEKIEKLDNRLSILETENSKTLLEILKRLPSQ